MAFGGSIKLTGESEYRKALKDITSDMRLMSSEMKVLATSTATDGASSDAARAKKEALSKAIQEQKDKIASLNSALQASNAQNGENSSSSKALQTQINNATANLNKMEAQLGATDAEGRKLGTGFDDTGKKASIFGDVLKANLASEAIVASVKAIGDGIVQLGKAFVGMVGDSVKAYAEYEQLVGGVETLFKDAAPKVQEYANAAFSTAGLSANDYMEQVTSFSATLLQGLGGDTAKATEAANQAIIDMSDNANKMGTDISLIQNAYQGFAKDNYTMLDNLKLGYGGTASEMARLVNESGVLGEGIQVTAETVKDVPFDQITNAIHAVQNELGITGTTAKEASSTISGSFNSVKASWENVLSSFGGGSDEQISAAIDGLVEGVTNLATNVTAILPNIVEGLGQLIVELVAKIPELLTQIVPTLLTVVNSLVQTIVTVLPQIIPVVIQILMGLVNTIIQNLPMIIQAGITLLVSLIQGIAQALPQLIPQIVEAVVLMMTTLLDNIDLIIDAGIQLLLGLINGIVAAVPKLIDKMPEIIEKVVTALINNLPKIIEAGIKIIIALAGALIQAVPQLISKIPQIIGSIVGAFGDGLSKMGDVGKNLVQGIWNGISNATGWIMDKIKGFGNSVMNGIKSFFGIKSPSRKMRDEVGKFLGEGVGVGFEDSMKDVTKDMQNAIPTNFDTGVTLATTTTTNALTNAARAGSLAGGLGALDIASAIKDALEGMNVVMDGDKMGSFVTDTIEQKVFN